LRYTVTVESPATEHDIMRVLDEGDAHSPYLDNFSRAIPCRRSVHIVSSATVDTAQPAEASS
jgi:hypothetical protein